MDIDAVRATQRLTSRGFDAFLVGGCVRDLLLGRAPKDYDIATEARPPQVKRTFPRNCRIIGRRFKLAHLHFHNNSKILECSTFRRTPQLENTEDDLLITRDNEFGTAEEDALRRDFTVNALFLDPIKDRILDFADGLPDVRARVIRTIGDPKIRFREDPVRILRAAKFAGRLGFHIDPETLAGMAAVAPDLTRAAPPRVLEEILRLLRSGHALDSFQLLRDVGALKSLLPVVAEFLAEAPQPQRVSFWRLLDALDHRVQQGAVPINPVLLGVLFTGAVDAAAERTPEHSPTTVSEELLGPLSQTLRLPRRDAGCLKRMCAVQHRFDQPDPKKRFRVHGFVRSVYFAEALELFELRCLAEGHDLDVAQQWQQTAREAGIRLAPQPRPQHGLDQAAEDADSWPEDVATVEGDTDSGDGGEGGRDEGAEREGGGRRRRRRRRRRGRRDGREGAAAASEDDGWVAPGAAEPIADEAGDDEAATTAGDAEPEDFDDERSAMADTEAEAASPADGEAASEGGGRRRRRRRRRRGGRGDDERGAAAPGAESAERPVASEPQARQQQPQQPRRQQQQQQPQQHGRRDDGGRRGGRRRGRDRDRDRGRPHGNRDVDVVSRHQDRRGKVEVIEPPPLDLSAFDAELDPKHVPTFGSIVEGARRKKPRQMRPGRDGIDDYRPPPPPGSDAGPGAPPPPPPPEPDEFGDW